VLIATRGTLACRAAPGGRLTGDGSQPLWASRDVRQYIMPCHPAGTNRGHATDDPIIRRCRYEGVLTRVHRPLTAATRVRIPHGTPSNSRSYGAASRRTAGRSATLPRTLPRKRSVDESERRRIARAAFASGRPRLDMPPERLPCRFSAPRRAIGGPAVRRLAHGWPRARPETPHPQSRER